MTVIKSIEQIRNSLDQLFGALEPDLVGFRLVAPGLDSAAIVTVESELAVTFPSEFRAHIGRFDFGSLTIGPIVFGSGTDYATQLLRFNVAPDMAWWGPGDRPVALVMIANSDPFTIVLDTSDGSVSVLRHGLALDGAVRVARSSDLFIRGIGTAMVLRAREEMTIHLASLIASEVGSSREGEDYWAEHA